MLQKITTTIEELESISISEKRKKTLKSLIDYIQKKVEFGDAINLNFICTHNSRRSHFAQIWAQTMASYFAIQNVKCFSGGTEATAIFTMVKETLEETGFVFKITSEGNNPSYNLFFSEEEKPIVSFSKTYDDAINPSRNFAAIMTCSQADENCPFIPGADKRIPITYKDPKEFDNTAEQKEKYKERSIQIATEMRYVFSMIK